MPKDTFPAAGSGLPEERQMPGNPAIGRAPGRGASELPAFHVASMVEALSRRAMLGRIPLSALATTAILPIVAMAEAPDSVFEKIENFRRLEDAFGEACKLTDKVQARMDGRSITDADEAHFDMAQQASSDALKDLTKTVPTTLAGIHALLSFVNGLQWEGHELGEAVNSALIPILIE